MINMIKTKNVENSVVHNLLHAFCYLNDSLDVFSNKIYFII